MTTPTTKPIAGPWRVNEHQDIGVCVVDGGGSMNPYVLAQTRATAALIASAPDLIARAEAAERERDEALAAMSSDGADAVGANAVLRSDAANLEREIIEEWRPRTEIAEAQLKLADDEIDQLKQELRGATARHLSAHNAMVAAEANVARLREALEAIVGRCETQTYAGALTGCERDVLADARAALAASEVKP